MAAPVQISYFPTSEAVPQVRPPAEGGPDAAVVIDVLRATTTIAWSLENGAEAIEAFAELEPLDAAAAAWPQDLRLRAGERGGTRVDGYDLGNSPLAVTRELVGGKRIFMSTTNGTRSLAVVKPVPLLVTACLPNRSAVARRLLDRECQQVWIVGSGNLLNTIGLTVMFTAINVAIWWLILMLLMANTPPTAIHPMNIFGMLKPACIPMWIIMAVRCGVKMRTNRFNHLWSLAVNALFAGYGFM